MEATLSSIVSTVASQHHKLAALPSPNASHACPLVAIAFQQAKSSFIGTVATQQHKLATHKRVVVDTLAAQQLTICGEWRVVSGKGKAVQPPPDPGSSSIPIQHVDESKIPDPLSETIDPIGIIPTEVDSFISPKNPELAS
ncbi:hypothetical protein F0562_025420 [Nyssa sinensis]|uniref:Uncharacterized protein n=1 Tax=Nyssa sinensis TaxID=561372 RepID=A0A5J5BI35_9ASTE|nr:hypothetical protein F0562_025420 [Nyssa sinensis]